MTASRVSVLVAVVDVELPTAGDLMVPLARTFAFEDARAPWPCWPDRARAGSWRWCPACDVATARQEAGLLASGWTARPWRANCLSSA